MQTTLKSHAQKLRLSGLLSSLELRIQEAESNRLPYSQFLELVFQDELDVRISRQVARRNKAACFRDTRSLEDFDFGFNPSVPRGRIYQLAACQFVRQKRDVLLVGPPGVGKSHIAQAIGAEAIKAGLLCAPLPGGSRLDRVRRCCGQSPGVFQRSEYPPFLRPEITWGVEDGH